MLKPAIKRVLFGKRGVRPRKIRHGLLRGLRFNIDAAEKSLRLIGFDEREITSVVRRLAGHAAAALDIGTNDGWYTLYFASRPNIKRVISFEPQATLIESARENLKLNDPAFLAKVELVPKLVGDRDDDAWCSLDAMFPELPRPTLIKLDVDGGELAVLHGARRHLSKNGVVLVIETHSPQLERDCAAFLKGLGYHVKIINNAWYRAIIPESRSLELNRWMVATR